VVVGPKWGVGYAVNVGTHFPLTGDSIHFKVVVSAVDIPLATYDVTWPAPAIASGRTGAPSDLVDDPDHSNLFTGCWKILTQSGKASPLFVANKLVELESKGVGIARNEHGNTEKNVYVFQWESNSSDSIWLSEPSIGRKAYAFKLDQDKIVLKRTVGGTASEIVLQKISDNPYQLYVNHFPSNPKDAASWTEPARITNENKMDFYGPNYFDFYPAADRIGEMINYNKTASLDSLIFVTYNYTENTIRQSNVPHLYELMKSVYGDTDTSQYYYVFHWINEKIELNIDCFVSDGIMILNQVGADGMYMVKAGPPHWHDLAALHKQYNAHVGRAALPPYGTHWVRCGQCNGHGEIVSFGRVVTGSDPAGFNTYQDGRGPDICPSCNGVRGFYVDDKTLKRVNP